MDYDIHVLLLRSGKLPYLKYMYLPQLTTPPVNTQALCILASVAGDTLTRHLSKILQALLGALSEAAGSPEYEDALGHCQGVVLAVTDEAGVNTIVDELLQHSKLVLYLCLCV